ncbi:hypothetical protein AAG570_005467 [Ranatra chinensis]|uniref:Mos1 transposase HTH domain-containing protein n=1 Tax=Ranatra chinensis TaxID=642074 RepID=A0ABD0XXI2_9HEMI
MSSQQANSPTSAEDVRSTYRRCEIRSVIKFFTLHRKPAAETHRQLVDTHGHEAMSHQHVKIGTKLKRKIIPPRYPKGIRTPPLKMASKRRNNGSRYVRCVFITRAFALQTLRH